MHLCTKSCQIQPNFDKLRHHLLDGGSIKITNKYAKFKQCITYKFICTKKKNREMFLPEGHGFVALTEAVQIPASVNQIKKKKKPWTSPACPSTLSDLGFFHRRIDSARLLNQIRASRATSGRRVPDPPPRRRNARFAAGDEVGAGCVPPRTSPGKTCCPHRCGRAAPPWWEGGGRRHHAAPHMSRRRGGKSGCTAPSGQ